jgi:hypothetical protein
MTGQELAQAVEIGLGHEMVENVDHHAGLADFARNSRVAGAAGDWRPAQI